MGILPRYVAFAALFATGYVAQAFEQRVLYFNIPTTGTYPQTIAPAFPPAPTGTNQLTEWRSWDGDTSASMGLPSGGDAGLLVPNLAQLWDTLGVPTDLRGSLLSLTLNVEFYAQQEVVFTRTEEDGTFVATTQNTLRLYDFVSPSFAEDPFLITPTGNILTRTLALSATNTLSGLGDTKTNFVFATDSPTAVELTGGSNFDIASATNTPSFFTLPVSFLTAAEAVTGGNAEVDYTPFGATRITMTYTFLPESDFVWAGFPVVAGAWFVRRRLYSRSTAK